MEDLGKDRCRVKGVKSSALDIFTLDILNYPRKFM